MAAGGHESVGLAFQAAARGSGERSRQKRTLPAADSAYGTYPIKQKCQSASFSKQSAPGTRAGVGRADSSRDASGEDRPPSQKWQRERAEADEPEFLSNTEMDRVHEHEK